MATITNESCAAQQGGGYNAACDVTFGQGETEFGIYVRIFPTGSPNSYMETFLSHQGNGHYASSWAMAPGGTNPPYQFIIRAVTTVQQVVATNPGNVT